MVSTATKEQAHELVERLDPAQVKVVVEQMEKLLDPLEYALKNAPFEDEEISDEENLRAAEFRANRTLGDATSHEDLLKEFGITQDDVDRVCSEPFKESGLCD